MAWDFYESTGKTKSLGIGTWHFYDSNGILQATVSAGGGGAIAGTLHSYFEFMGG